MKFYHNETKESLEEFYINYIEKTVILNQTNKYNDICEIQNLQSLSNYFYSNPW